MRITQQAIGAAVHSPNSHRLYTSSYRGDIYVHDTQTGETLSHWTIGGGPLAPELAALAIDRDETRLATGESTLHIFELPTGKLLTTYPTPGIRSIALLTHATVLIDVKGHIHLLDSQGKALHQFSPREKTGTFTGKIVRVLPWQDHFCTLHQIKGTFRLLHWDSSTLVHSTLIQEAAAVVPIPFQEAVWTGDPAGNLSRYPSPGPTLQPDPPCEFPNEMVLPDPSGRYLLVADGWPTDPSHPFTIWDAATGQVALQGQQEMTGMPFHLASDLSHLIAWHQGSEPGMERIPLT